MSIQDDPTTFVIFGASGDLTARKLVPALFDLDRSGVLPARSTILGAARTEMTDDDFRNKIGGLADHNEDRDRWNGFLRRLHYQPLDYAAEASYRDLRRRIERQEGNDGGGAHRILNLALPPTLYGTVATRLAQSGLAKPKGPSGAWTRLVVEKPFGRDLGSSLELQQAISRGFTEDQVFRIDHYLAKEKVQNILVFRFANTLFEPIWNRQHIAWVSITAAESLGVEHRAGYYDGSGVMRDMFQNHMMQLLALVASEPPSKYEADLVRNEKVKLFRSLRPFDVSGKYNHVVLGQYDGYREEPGVASDSLTPTYATTRSFIDNWRWQGVPFYLTSGKKLREKMTRIDIQFKRVPHAMFRDVVDQSIARNRLTLSIYPQEEIVLSIRAKTPGSGSKLRAANLKLDYHDGFDGPALDAYARALGDVIRGDHMLFWRQDALEQTWSYFEPIISACEHCGDRPAHLHQYAQGSTGPEAAAKILPEPWPGGD